MNFFDLAVVRSAFGRMPNDGAIGKQTVAVELE